MLLTLSRYFKSCFQHIQRNFKLSVASVLIMTLTFFVSTVFVIALYGSTIILNYFENQSQIIVFFNPATASSDYITKVQQQIANQKGVTSIKFVSKQDAYKKFLDFLKQDSPSLSQSVNADKLPASLEIKTDNIDDLQKVAVYVDSLTYQGNYIDKILYYKNVEEFLKEFIKVVRLAGLVFISFLGGISLLIVWITIGIALSSHADEIEIMQLVGATRSYIEMPYIIEGAIYGICGALISTGAIVGAIIALTKINTSQYLVFISYFKGVPIPTFTLQQVLIGFIIEIGIGAFVGSFGSFLAVRRKLK